MRMEAVKYTEHRHVLPVNSSRVLLAEGFLLTLLGAFDVAPGWAGGVEPAPPHPMVNRLFVEEGRRGFHFTEPWGAPFIFYYGDHLVMTRAGEEW